jgi:hypothetical protein
MKYKYTHLVLNTGAWWNYERLVMKPSHVRYRDTWGQRISDKDVLDAFASHFSHKGFLYDIMYQLKKRGIQIIWRDITAAGICTNHRVNDFWEYRKLFPVFNAIARKAVLDLGGLVIPDVWESSLGYWGEHRMGYPNHDYLHWCDGTKHALPSLWNSNLFDLLEANADVMVSLPATALAPKQGPTKWWRPIKRDENGKRVYQPKKTFQPRGRGGGRGADGEQDNWDGKGQDLDQE